MSRSHKWLTPDTLPTAAICRRLVIPNDLGIVIAVSGALDLLGQPENWEQFGAITPDEISEAMRDMLWRYLNEGTVCMIGAILPFATAAMPDNALACDGATYNREDYPELYSVLDAAYIIDADKFSVPDMQNAAVVGAGDVWLVGDSGGEIEHTLTTAEMPTHSHTYVPPVFNVDIEAPGAPDPIAAGIGLPTNTGDAGGGNPHNNMPPYVALRYCIIAR
jgi:microcystin-dependent protein